MHKGAILESKRMNDGKGCVTFLQRAHRRGWEKKARVNLLEISRY